MIRKGLTLESTRSILHLIFGISITLAVGVLAGDTQYFGRGFPIGWFALWLLTTSTSLSFGIVMFIGASWRKIPLEERRLVAMGYLLLGFVNFIILNIHVDRVGFSGSMLWNLVSGYGVGLLIVYWRFFHIHDQRDEIFP